MASIAKIKLIKYFVSSEPIRCVLGIKRKIVMNYMSIRDNILRMNYDIRP